MAEHTPAPVDCSQVDPSASTRKPPCSEQYQSRLDVKQRVADQQGVDGPPAGPAPGAAIVLGPGTNYAGRW
jgi:hypothetical protein